MNDRTSVAGLSALALCLLDEIQRESGRDKVLALESDAQLALAVELKDFHLATWTSEPMRCKDASNALDWLSEVTASDHVAALADWARSGAMLADGDMEAAIANSEAAEAWFTERGNPVSAARVSIPRIMALAQLGRIEEAEQCARRALAVFESSRDHASAGKVELNLGSLLLQQDRYDDAIGFYRSASVRFARVGNSDYSILADIGHADALTEQLRFDQALLLYERANARAIARNATVSIAYVRQSLGLLERYRGNVAKSLRWLQLACNDYARSDDVRQLAECELDMAAAYAEAGLLPEADRLYAAVIDRMQAVGSKVEQTWAALHRGRVLLRLGNLDAAAALALESYTRFVSFDTALGVAHANLLVAEIAMASNEATLADARLNEVIRTCESENSLALSLAAELALGELHLNNAREEEARLHFESAFARANKCGQRAMAFRATVNLARVAERSADAETAMMAYDRAASELEVQHRLLQSDDLKQSYRASGQLVFDRLVVLRAKHDDVPQTFSAMERGRAYAHLNHTEAANPDSTDSELSTQALQITSQLKWARRELGHAVESEDSLHHLRETVRHLETELIESTRRARIAQLSVGPDNVASTDAPTIEAVQQALGSDDAMIQYYRVATKCFVCVITKTNARVHQIDDTDIPTLVRQTRFQIDAMSGAMHSLPQHRKQLERRVELRLQQLGAQLLSPIADVLESKHRLLIVPHSVLHYVPFAALIWNGRPLIVTHDLLMLPSARVLKPKHHVPLKSAADNVEPRALVVGAMIESLPHIGTEANEISRRLGACTSLVGEDATVARVLASLPGADVVHLACHGQFRADNPYFSALHLADGTLSVHDMTTVKLRARLVTLSACETGLSQLSPGEELLGLTRAFMQAGVEYVVNSLWAVDDRATALLMLCFYRRVAEGVSIPCALRLAQIEMLNGDEAYSHPYYWSGFVVSGNSH